nr:RNA-directed DNA polymerase, eukaryota [Tanacetum cinerariifolium]
MAAGVVVLTAAGGGVNDGCRLLMGTKEKKGWCGSGGGGSGLWMVGRRVGASDIVDRVDRVIRILFGFAGKSPPEKFFGSGVVAGGAGRRKMGELIKAEFVAKERIVLIDIEGVPLHAWSRATFAKIGSKWGEMMDLEDGTDDLFAPVSDTYFGDNVVNVDNAKVQGQEKDFGNPTFNVEVSSDPFNIYGLLNNRKKENGTASSNMTPPFPPGFTPEVRQQGHYDNENPNVENVVDTNVSPCKSVGSNTRIAKQVGNVE